jgi:hypothetical protein
MTEEGRGRVRHFTGDWRAFALGGLPHIDAEQAWKTILTHTPHVPSWPQLPRRGRLENMYVQFSERFPGINLDGDALHVDRRRELGRGLEQLYLAYLEGEIEYGRISAAHAAGLEALRHGDIQLPDEMIAVKGQITGPVSWGLTIVDQNRRPILYDQVLEDAVGKHLRLKAAWQEQKLRAFCEHTILFVDEPYIATLGSSFITLSRGQVIVLLEEIFAGLTGIKGIHCCGNADWSIVFNTSVDIVSLDAYDYAETLLPYAQDVKQFLKRGGLLAWGIVPAGAASRSEDTQSLVQRLIKAIDALSEAGVPREALLRAGMVSPSCSLGSLPVDLAEQILALTAEVSFEMRRRHTYFLSDTAELAR